jgi:hypothetical protein
MLPDEDPKKEEQANLAPSWQAAELFKKTPEEKTSHDLQLAVDQKRRAQLEALERYWNRRTSELRFQRIALEQKTRNREFLWGIGAFALVAFVLGVGR